MSILEKINVSIQHHLEVIFQEIKNNQDIMELQRNLKNTETSGEILYESLNKILLYLNIQSTDSVVDLGSGVGKSVLQFFLTTPVKEAMGIEILPHLHEIATVAMQKTKIIFPEFFKHNRKLTFINQDFLKISLSEFSIIFINATCFSQPLLYEISKLLNHSSTTHTILSTRPIYYLDKKFIFKQSISIECSWDSALCYIYQNSNKI